MAPKKFVPRQRKHKVLAREKARENGVQDGASAPTDGDSNALEILPDVKKAREAQRAQMREELKGEVKVSGKKAKRLEKYIDNKLKKDENRALLAQLAKNKVDTSLFASSRSLGQGKETKRQALGRAYREQKAGVGQDNEDLLFESRDAPESDDSDSDAGIVSHKTKATSPPVTSKHQQKVEIVVDSQAPTVDSQTAKSVPLAGSGLKRPLELDDEGRPVIQKRQKRGGVKSKISATPQFIEEEQNEDEDDEWNGFSSDAAADKSSMDEDSDDGSDDESADESSEEDETSSDEDDEDGDESNAKERSSAFKAWAHGQRNEALGYRPVESTQTTLNIPVPENFKPRPVEQEPLPTELMPTTNTGRKAFSVPVQRSPEIQNARLQLPVVAEEQRIMEAIHNNNVVVVCGATGSGKTTQVPQFLFEAGYGSPDSPTPGLIGVTQPRRIAAVSMSKRVGQELGDRADSVAYQIRFERTSNEKTALKFMTDGVLLREVAEDLRLSKYSAVIIDEAHERSINTDVLIGMLSRVVKVREEEAKEGSKLSPLKLIIMSATLRVDDITNNPTLFPTPPPVLNVEGRQHPVTTHFARQTKHDYVDEAFKKITRGHRKLPPGSFLVFLTGHDEISRLSKKLKLASGSLNPAPLPKVRISSSDMPLEAEDVDFGDTRDDAADQGDELAFFDDEVEENEEDDAMFEADPEAGPAPAKMHVLPLYSLLPTRDQMRVFEDPPEGSRAIILATNVAETSLTIPGVRYVFDCGRVKERKYNPETGVQSYEIGWISKASANQRSGRAGRTGPGHCYRLYSSAVFDRDLPEFADPEILRMPIEGVVLQLKAMGIQKVVNYPFPTPPDRHSLAKAEKLLQYLSALTPTGHATQIGETMARFPLPPRFARILLIGHLHDCLHYTVALVAGLSVAEIFIPESQAVPALTSTSDSAEVSSSNFRTNEDVAAETRAASVRKAYHESARLFRSLDDSSDAVKLLQAVGEFAHEERNGTASAEAWCARRFVRHRALRETQQLRRQLTALLSREIPAYAALRFEDALPRPSTTQVQALKQMIAAGFVDQVAVRADLAPNPPELHRKPRRAIDVPYVPLQPLPYVSTGDPVVDRTVYIHPSSSLAQRSPQECPDYIVYAHLQRASSAGELTGKGPAKIRMLPLTDVSGAQLAALAKGTPLLSYGKPVKELGGDGKGTTRTVLVRPYLKVEKTPGMGWELPLVKVAQKKDPKMGWVAV
ncbi:P-loop containing nucleoside triphosphate hydrolase protein [Xylariomycetidae sp. FL0641]|nr:P-loop containing nucleoside triphosphate hydrolase protein [Xylariomycetidae sp. FL0641]